MKTNPSGAAAVVADGYKLPMTPTPEPDEVVVKNKTPTPDLSKNAP